MWTSETLQSFVAERLNGVRFICVANREPYIHSYGPSGIQSMEPSSGVVSALDPVMRAAGGVWIGHGSGTADRETADSRGRLRVPPGEDLYTLRRVWLTKDEEDGYYYGFANEALWPLCHIAYQRPTFEETDWKHYVAVNEKFADAVVEEANGGRALVFIQDYHFSLLSKMVKQRLPAATVFQFWHIPWPNPEAFRICPWKQEILEGLLGNDLLAFHIQYHCINFMDTIDRELESRVDREHSSVTQRGSVTLVRPYPISVDFEALSKQASGPPVRDLVAGLRKEHRLEGLRVALGVDRLDYTKGILERMRLVDRFLTRHPEFAEKFLFVEIGVPSRTHIRAYQKFQDDLESLIEEVNWKHHTPTWQPILFIKEHQDRSRLMAWYRLAEVCLVSSLHDGMNLVAKEFVAARTDLRGVLLLSRFTGASRELVDAMLINPYATDAAAEALYESLTMPHDEQAARMERMRQIVSEHNVYRWIAKLVQGAARLEPSFK